MNTRERYFTVNLQNETLTDEVIVTSVNKDGTINTVDTNRLMLMKTLFSISFDTQKEAEHQAVKNFLSALHLFKDADLYARVSEFTKEYYPELVI